MKHARVASLVVLAALGLLASCSGGTTVEVFYVPVDGGPSSPADASPAGDALGAADKNLPDDSDATIADSGRADSGAPDASPPDDGGAATDADGGGSDAAPDARDAGPGACTNSPDLAIVGGATFSSDIGTCGQNNLGAEPATKNCIKGLGLSDGCATCLDNNVQCVVSHCIGACLADQNSVGCVSCRAQNCDTPFATCSGLP